MTERFAPSHSGTIRIVMLGDSLTAGYGLKADEALPVVVERQLKAAGLDVELINSGISGDTTGGGLFRFDDSVTYHKPDILVIALGTNDFLMGIPVAAARQNLETIIKRAKDGGVFVVLVGIRPKFNGVPDALQSDYANMLEQLAADTDIPFHPSLMKGVWGNEDLIMPDGLHPTAEGVEVMGERLSETLKTVLAPNSASGD